MTYATAQTITALLSDSSGPLADQRVSFSLGNQSLEATTDVNGRAAVTLSVLGRPETTPYALQATFEGTPQLAGSSTVAPVTLRKQITALSVATATIAVDSGEAFTVIAQLRDGQGRGVAERSVVFVIRRDDTGAVVYSEPVLTNYLGEARLNTIALPVGSYSSDLFFSGNVAGSATTLVDDFYEPALLLDAVSLAVAPGNAAPTAVGDAAETNQNVALLLNSAALLTNDNDVDGDVLTAQLENGAAAAFSAQGGSVAFNAGTFIYTPPSGFSGVDSFRYEACDSAALCSVARVTINVLPPQILPALTVNAPSVTVAEGQTANAGGTVTLLAGLPVTLTTNIGSVVDNGNGTWSWSYATSDGPDDSAVVTITADAGYAATSTSFNLLVDDVAPNIALSVPATVEAGVPFSLTLGAVTDPGDDVMVAYHISWGDGSPKEIVTAGPTLSHVYALPGTYTIAVDLLDDEENTFLNSGTVTVNVSGPNGSTAAINTTLMLHTVDQRRPKEACPNGAGSCKWPSAGAVVRVFNRDDFPGAEITLLEGGNITLTRNPNGGLYPDIFESEHPAIPYAECTTDASGTCTVYVPAAGDFLTVVKYVDGDMETNQAVYTGRPLDNDSFIDITGDGMFQVVTKEFQVVKFFKRSGAIQYGGGNKTVFVGSVLEIIAPDYAVWEEGVTNFVYPFIFIADSDWQLDVCAEVPQGYAIVGVYDDDGNLVSGNDCHQTVVANQSRVVAFEVLDLESPPPHITARVRIRHDGRYIAATLESPGRRVGIDRRGEHGPPVEPPGRNNRASLPSMPLALVGVGIGGVWLIRRRPNQ